MLGTFIELHGWCLWKSYYYTWGEDGATSTLLSWWKVFWGLISRSFKTIPLQKSPLISTDQVLSPWGGCRVVRIMKLHSSMHVWNLLWNTALHLLILGSLVEISNLNIVIHLLFNPHSHSFHLSKSFVICCCVYIRPHWFIYFSTTL